MKGLKIASIAEHGTASEIGLGPGDEILSINGQAVEDWLAYRYLIAGEDVTILVKKKDGGLLDIDLEKDADDDLGVEPAPMRVRCCNNKCVFCFVAQMPKGLRRTLYVKDEDYRQSFLYGTYITLTTLGDEDYRRIIRERLSPLYVSVHTTDEETRRFLLGNRKAPSVMDGIKRLTEGGITLHTQAVICPGLNDGEKLIRTVEDLAGLYPKVASLAVVPIGLTKHRERLYPLKGFTKSGAARLLDSLEQYRKKYRKVFGEAFVYPSDEFYIKAGRDFPEEKEYDGYPQIDNGVGLVRDFMTEFEREKRKHRAKPSTFSLRKEKVAKRNGDKEIILVTGESFAPYLQEAAKALSITLSTCGRGHLAEPKAPKMNKCGAPEHEGERGKAGAIHLKVLPVKNELFGHSVTVTGLLCGKDIADALKGKRADLAIIPSVTMRDGDGVFLDDMTPEDVERESGLRVIMVEPTAKGLIEAIRNLSLARMSF